MKRWLVGSDYNVCARVLRHVCINSENNPGTQGAWVIACVLQPDGLTSAGTFVVMAYSVRGV